MSQQAGVDRCDPVLSSDSDGDSVYVVEDRTTGAAPASTATQSTHASDCSHAAATAASTVTAAVLPSVRSCLDHAPLLDCLDGVRAAPTSRPPRAGAPRGGATRGGNRKRACDPAASDSANQPPVLARKTARAAGANERLRKKREKEMSALLRRALAEQRKASRPGECDKHMLIECDRCLLGTELGDAIRSLAEVARVGFDFCEHAMLNTILFKRRRTEFNVDAASGTEQDIIRHITLTAEGIAVVLSTEDFLTLVKSFVDERRGIVLDARSALPLKDYAMRVYQTFTLHPTLIVIGCDSYFSSCKAKKSKAAATQRGQTLPAAARDVTRLDVEECCVDLQLKSNISVIHCGTIAEAAQTVMHLNKAIAETPYKREKLAAVDDGQMTVAKLCKDGRTGIAMMWRKMLQELRNVSPEVAEAIVDAYPSPRALFEAYKCCESEANAVALLEDLQVRRGTGALQTIRRVGKELSRRVYQLFVLTDPTFVIA